MSEMVERVARAIAGHFGFLPRQEDRTPASNSGQGRSVGQVDKKWNAK